MNELAPTNTSNFDAIANSADSLIQGELIVFRKGKYPTGMDKTGDMTEATLVVHDVTEAWIRFEDQKPVEAVVRTNAFPLPARDTLGYTEQSEWEVDVNGEPRDPWARSFYLYLLSGEQSRDFTFCTSSWGGMTAVRALCRQVMIKR